MLKVETLDLWRLVNCECVRVLTLKNSILLMLLHPKFQYFSALHRFTENLRTKTKFSKKKSFSATATSTIPNFSNAKKNASTRNPDSERKKGMESRNPTCYE